MEQPDYATKGDLIRFKDEILEHIADVETRILRAMEHYTRATEAHFRTLDAYVASGTIGQHALMERMSALEARVLDLESRRPTP